MRHATSFLFLLIAAVTTMGVIAVGISVLLAGLVHAGEGSLPTQHIASTKDQTTMPDPKSQSAVQTGQLSSSKYFAECMRDWDAETHMTRQEWSRTCRRVVDNREKFLRGQKGR